MQPSKKRCLFIKLELGHSGVTTPHHKEAGTGTGTGAGLGTGTGAVVLAGTGTGVGGVTDVTEMSWETFWLPLHSEVVGPHEPSDNQASPWESGMTVLPSLTGVIGQ